MLQLDYSSQKFLQNDIIYAAAGVKILAPDLDDAIAGGPIRAVGIDQDVEEIIIEVQNELEAITIDTADEGIILKADTLGSLEAAAGLFQLEQISIRKASVGAVSKQDVMDALASREVDDDSGQICVFNIKILPDAQEEAFNQGIPIFSSPVVYRVVDEYKEYIENRRNDEIA